jgi:hypothetical protein
MMNAYTNQLTACDAQIEQFLATMESRVNECAPPGAY